MNTPLLWLCAVAVSGLLASCGSRNSGENTAIDSTARVTVPPAAPLRAEAAPADLLGTLSEVEFATQLADDFWPLNGVDVVPPRLITNADTLTRLTGRDWLTQLRADKVKGFSLVVKSKFGDRTFLLMRSNLTQNPGGMYIVLGVVLDSQNQPLASAILMKPGSKTATVEKIYHTVTLTRQGNVECRYIFRNPQTNVERVEMTTFPVTGNTPLEAVAQ